MAEASQEAVWRLISNCATAFGPVLESLTGREVRVEDPRICDVEAVAASQLHWWKQRFNVAGQAWIGAPQLPCLELGGLVLRSAGVDHISETEAADTWREILQQALSGFATLMGDSCGLEVTCRGNVEPAEAPSPAHMGTFQATVDGREIVLFAGFDSSLATLFAERAAARPASSVTMAEEAASTAEYAPLQSLLDSKVCVRLVIGRARLKLADALRLTSGSVVELDRAVNQPIEIVVNHQVIGRGQAVQVNGNYAIRIEELQSSFPGKF